MDNDTNEQIDFNNTNTEAPENDNGAFSDGQNNNDKQKQANVASNEALINSFLDRAASTGVKGKLLRAGVKFTGADKMAAKKLNDINQKTLGGKLAQRSLNKAASLKNQNENNSEANDESTSNEDNKQQKANKKTNQNKGLGLLKSDKEKKGSGIKLSNKTKLYLLLIFGGFFFIFFIIMAVALGEEYEVNEENAEVSKETEKISYTTSSIDKETFIEKIQLLTDYPELIEKSEFIWDLSNNNHMNPELVVLYPYILSKELGLSSEAKETIYGGHNYWLIDCKSDGSECKEYNTFEEALTDFLTYASKYSSAFELVQNDVLTRLSKDNSCDIKLNDDASNCENNDELKEMVNTQTNNILDMFAIENKNIFDVDPPTYNTDISKCTDILRQGDYPDIMMNCDSSVADIGCFVTSLAIGMTCSGIQLKDDPFDMQSYITTMINGGCINQSGCLSTVDSHGETCKGITDYAPSFKVLEPRINVINLDFTNKVKKIEEYNVDGNVIVLQLHLLNNYGNEHYVVYSRTVGREFVTLDPGYGAEHNYNSDAVKGFTVFKTHD